MNPSDFSIVIPTLNEADNIACCVNSAVAARAGEILVVDGGSNDLTCNIASDCGATVFRCDAGRAKQLNFGAAQAKGDALIFLHADNWLAESAIEEAAQLLNDTAGSWGAFRQQIDADGLLYRWLEKGNAARVTLLGIPYGDQGMFLGRTLFEEVGRFPDEPLMEDLILSKRLRKCEKPALLSGPIHISSRRWDHHGVIRQTARNFYLRFAFAFGISPTRLRQFYPNHVPTNKR